MPAPFVNLRHFIDELRKEQQIIDVHHPVDPTLELAEIHRRVSAADGPALFFHNVVGSSFPVTTNLFGSIRRIDLAFGSRPEAFIKNCIHLATSNFPPSPKTLWEKRHTLKGLLKMGTKKMRRAPITERIQKEPNLEALPLLKSWPEDGGHFITLPLVYTEPLGGGPPNLGMYRVQRYNKKEAGLHFQIQKGGGFHYHAAEKQNHNLPVNILIGGPPALILSAITPLPENVSELLIASLLQGGKIKTTRSPLNHYPIVSECEFALMGHAKPHIRRAEGPFGDHYGYYSLKHDFPTFECEMIAHRKDAIYPATVVGKPKQEDFYIGDYLQRLLSPLFPMVMPGVKDLWSYGETGFHSLSSAVVKDRFPREAMTSAFRILGEGQLSLTKFLLLTDQRVELQNFKQTLTAVLERFRPETDLFIFSNLSLDTLDYTGPKLNKGSRGILLGVGEKIRDLPTEYRGPLPAPLRAAKVFSPGCLVVEGTEPNSLLPHFKDPSFASFPLIILVDDVQKTTKDDAAFLWTVFTRFEPAADIYASETETRRHHLCYTPPLLIDARMKPSYPQEVLCDESTASKVTDNWKKYFPQGLEMGNSFTGHVV